MDIHFFWLEFQLGLFKNLNDAYYLCDSLLLPDTKLYDQFPEGYANLFIVTDVARVTVTDVVFATSWPLPSAKTL